MQVMAWDDWRIFLEVQRTGSHARAARKLGVDPTTVGRRLAALEGELGVRLFDRTPSGHVLSAAGSGVLGRAQRIEEEVTAASRELRGVDARVEGLLRITAGDGFISYVLLPALRSLSQEHPSLSFDLRPDTRMLDLSRREADVAVRLVRPKEPALVARHLGAMPFALFASVEYLQRRGTPRGARELATHQFIGFEGALDHLPQVRWLKKLVPNARYTVRATTTTSQVAACAEGFGIALLPCFVMGTETRIARILPRLAGPVRELWAVTHEDLRRNARVMTFVRWLTALLAARP